MEKLSFGQKAADLVASAMGSWAFILVQTAIFVVWIAANYAAIAKFDPYPFMLLNFVLSLEAAFAGPIIMMANNRQSEIDRANAQLDLETNVKAEAEVETLMARIEDLHAKIDAVAAKQVSSQPVWHWTAPNLGAAAPGPNWNDHYYGEVNPDGTIKMIKGAKPS